MLDDDILQEAKDRLCDRYTAAELVELLDLSTETFLDSFWDLLLQSCPEVLEEVGLVISEEEDDS